MTLSLFTLVHTIISLVGIFAGFGMLAGLLSGHRLRRWTEVFFLATTATSVTGFLFPFRGVTPGIILGVLSLIALAASCYAFYMRHLSGRWAGVFVVGATAAQYFNVFVLVAQLFRRVPALAELAPKQAEPPFAVTQGLVLITFVWLGVAATRRFHPGPDKLDRPDH